MTSLLENYRRVAWCELKGGNGDIVIDREGGVEVAKPGEEKNGRTRITKHETVY